ncbi:hypothetical protein [Citrobacter freundii]|uniref:hypothetical protein n=1 Tax=Citrobacter freundii TaxID=546 RepID=UPI00190395D5|nr:hypothetical protein [Citrobacter freundii]MBJ8931661.1 hypothetical protein [Citrobacter freundii]
MIFEEELRKARTFGSSEKHVVIVQSIRAFHRRKFNPAFQDWVNRLNKGERLPRGRFFAGKKHKPRLIFLDEYQQAK